MNADNEILLLYIPVMVWALLIIIFFYALSRKYTFGKWEKDCPNPFNEETLCFPKGTFRGILTITIMFVAILLEIFTLKHPEYENHIGKFLTAFQMVLAFYFGSQVMSTLTNAETKKTEAISGKLSEDEKPSTGDAASSDKKG